VLRGYLDGGGRVSHYGDDMQLYTYIVTILTYSYVNRDFEVGSHRLFAVLLVNPGTPVCRQPPLLTTSCLSKACVRPAKEASDEGPMNGVPPVGKPGQDVEPTGDLLQASGML
jgi:hypothetical protein